MKLLGNSGYGKTVTNVDRHRDVKYCTEIGTSALINNKRFRQLDVVTEDAYEIEMNKSVVKYTLPLHIGFFVYQYAKLHMLQFYYDIVDKYVERPLFQYCEMDTDSAYIALAGESIDGLVRADRRAHYFRNRSQWLPAECCGEHEDDYVCARIAGRPWTATESCCIARKAFDKRTPGLFKVEWRGDGFIGLCSKTYYCFGATDKYSTKGFSKRHNDIDKDTFLTVLRNRRSGGGFNRGFRVRDSSVMTYIQERASRVNLLLREAQSTSRRSQHGASGSVKGRDHQTTIHLPTWIRVGNILSRASSPDRLVAVRQRLSLDCYEMLPQ